MHFIDDIYFILSRNGRILHLLAQVAHLVDAVIGRRVDFYNVERTIAQRAADGAPPARRTVDGMLAVHGAGEDTGNARFTRAARSRKEIRVPDGIRRDLVFENAHDVFLTHHIVELRRSEFSIKG